MGPSKVLTTYRFSVPPVQVGLIGLTLSRFVSFRINVNLNCFVAADYHKWGKCERFFADEETLKANMKRKHPDRSTVLSRNTCINVIFVYIQVIV